MNYPDTLRLYFTAQPVDTFVLPLTGDTTAQYTRVYISRITLSCMPLSNQTAEPLNFNIVNPSHIQNYTLGQIGTIVNLLGGASSANSLTFSTDNSIYRINARRSSQTDFAKTTLFPLRDLANNTIEIECQGVHYRCALGSFSNGNALSSQVEQGYLEFTKVQ